MKKIIVKYIIPFLKSFVSTETDTEPKYVVGGFCTLLFGIGWCYHLYSHINIQSELIWADVALIAACFGLDVVNSVKAMSVKSEVASDVAKSNSNKETNDSAKEIIQSNKPQ